MMSALAAGRAEASPIVFYGADSGAGPGGVAPNANAASAAFHGAAGGTSLIDFENAPVGPFGTLVLAPGVTVTLTGNLETHVTFFAGITDVDRQSNERLGYNTTPGGSQHLRMAPQFGSAGAAMTFSFTTPVTGFGAFFTDTETGYPGPIFATFFDGTAQQIEILRTPTGGGRLFWGVTDFGAPVSSITLIAGSANDRRDLWGIDDVSFQAAAVPEPASLALVGMGLLALARARSRRRQA